MREVWQSMQVQERVSYKRSAFSPLDVVNLPALVPVEVTIPRRLSRHQSKKARGIWYRKLGLVNIRGHEALRLRHQSHRGRFRSSGPPRQNFSPRP